MLETLRVYAEQNGYLAELENRMKVAPRFSKLHHQTKPWWDISKVTASNYDSMIRQIRMILYDHEVVEPLESFTRFTHYASYAIHNEESLADMEYELARWQKSVNRLLGQYLTKQSKKFDTPKAHLMSHYVHVVRQFGNLIATPRLPSLCIEISRLLFCILISNRIPTSRS